MMFSMNVPYTAEEGASIPMEISNPINGLFHKAKGILMTGSEKCHISEHLAHQLNFESETGCPAIVILKNGTRLEIPIVFYRKQFLNETDAILGMAFLNKFTVIFDGPNRRASLSLPS